MNGDLLPLRIMVIQKFSDSVLDCIINSGDRALWVESLRTGAKQVNTVKEMVAYVINQCAEQKSQVSSLTISGHGNSKGFQIGNMDWVTSKSLPEFKDDLSKIAPLFIQHGAVYIEACETGQNTQLLREFSKVLGGVTVIARKTDQTSWGPSGPYSSETQN